MTNAPTQGGPRKQQRCRLKPRQWLWSSCFWRIQWLKNVEKTSSHAELGILTIILRVVIECPPEKCCESAAQQELEERNDKYPQSKGKTTKEFGCHCSVVVVGMTEDVCNQRRRFIGMNYGSFRWGQRMAVFAVRKAVPQLRPRTARPSYRIDHPQLGSRLYRPWCKGIASPHSIPPSLSTQNTSSWKSLAKVLMDVSLPLVTAVLVKAALSRRSPTLIQRFERSATIPSNLRHSPVSTEDLNQAMLTRDKVRQHRRPKYPSWWLRIIRLLHHFRGHKNVCEQI